MKPMFDDNDWHINKRHIEIVDKVIKVIPTPDKWCQGAYALDDAGVSTESDSEHACQWCLLGAFYKIASEMDHAPIVYEVAYNFSRWLIINKILDKKVPNTGSLIQFNDSIGTKHKDVIKSLRKLKNEYVSFLRTKEA